VPFIPAAQGIAKNEIHIKCKRSEKSVSIILFAFLELEMLLLCRESCLKFLSAIEQNETQK
jgi:hypothetical protein